MTKWRETVGHTQRRNLHRWMLATGVAFGVLTAATAHAGPRFAKGENGNVHQTAPSLAQFEFQSTPEFNASPMAPAGEFAPWAALEAQTAADDSVLDACLADKAACASVSLVRFRRMMELAAPLPKFEQLNLVHHYFNKITWTHDARDTWSTLYHTALTNQGDCEDIALAKYQTLRRLGWAAEDMRLLVGWDGEEKDWHAWLAVRTNPQSADTQTYILDSIEGLQRASAYRHARIVYSISDQGVWDHAPDYVPVARIARNATDDDRRVALKRAARHAANPQPQLGVIK